MKLYYSNIGNIFVDVAAITAKLANVDVELVRLTKEQASSKDYKLKCLTGKFPCLETADGHIFESAAIARYLARLNPDTKLGGANNHEAALID
jgi:glutathione S-transferase